MKAFEVHGGNGSFIQLEDGRFADTVTGDTSEGDMDPHVALHMLQDIGTEFAEKPFYGDWTAEEIEEYVGA